MFKLMSAGIGLIVVISLQQNYSQYVELSNCKDNYYELASKAKGLEIKSNKLQRDVMLLTNELEFCQAERMLIKMNGEQSNEVPHYSF